MTRATRREADKNRQHGVAYGVIVDQTDTRWRSIDVGAYDMCADADCDDCCPANAQQNHLDFLIDIERYTMERFGTGDGIVQWACVDCEPAPWRKAIAKLLVRGECRRLCRDRRSRCSRGAQRCSRHRRRPRSKLR